jgi:branched-chain amino acid transport system permease protein
MPDAQKLRTHLATIPALAYLLGLLVATAIEHLAGDLLASLLGLPGIPSLFGITLIQRSLLFLPGVILYDLIVYAVPTYVVARLLAPWMPKLTGKVPGRLLMPLYVLLIFLLVQLWGGFHEYRILVLSLMSINIILAVSLNLVNGYMGEFSVGHAGFMGVGAYIASILTVWVFPRSLGTFTFPLALLAGGIGAALAGLLVAIPSFKIRGDYLAIITLAVNYIIKNGIENIERIGGSRGFMGMAKLTNIPWAFIWAALTLWLIRNFVSSPRGRAVVAIREDEVAAETMTVNTRYTKILAFCTSSFFAGIAGGLFAHLLLYINPSTFSLLKSTEVLVMVYLGGMASISGSLVGAVTFTFLLEVLRPLEVWKWVLIPLLLVAILLRRHSGLMGFREFRFFIPKEEAESYGSASD